MVKKKKKATKAKPKPKPRITSVSQWCSVRLSLGVVQRLDRFAELETKRTGYKITRSRALEKLLAESLTRHETARAAAPKVYDKLREVEDRENN